MRDGACWRARTTGPARAPRRRRAATPGRGFVLALCVSGAVLAPAIAAGQGGAPTQARVRLSWVRGAGAASCPSARDLARDVAGRLGRDPFRDDARPAIEAVVTRDGSRWWAQIFVYDDDGALAGTRDLTSDAPACAPISNAAALAITLAIDPDAQMRPPDAQARPLAPPPPTTSAAAASMPAVPRGPLQENASAREAPARAPDGAPPPRDDGGRATAELVTSAGLLPRARPGIALGVDAAAFGPMRWAAGALWLSEALTADRRFAFGMVSAYAGLCAGGWPLAHLSLSACGSAMAGSIHAVVYNPIPLDPGERVWFGASLDGAAAVRIAGPLIARLSAQMVAPLIHRQFLVAGEAAPVFEQRPVALIAGAGLGIQFR